MKMFNRGILRNARCWGIASCLCATVPVPAFAGDGSELPELPIVLTASRMRQPLAEAPAAVTVIDREMIEHSGVRQVADLLRFVPGAVVGYNDGNWPVATLRGLSGVYASGLQVLIDGVSVYSPVFGGMLWGELPISINDIERIEVVRGPNGASWGANAFQGVVNIITRDPISESGTEFQANAGGVGIRDEVLRVAAGQGDWRYRATAGQNFDEGFSSREDSQRLSYANIKADYQVNSQDSIDMSLRWAEKNKQSTTGPTTLEHPITGNKMDFQGRWNHAESTDNEWWIQFYHQQFSQRDRLQINDLRPLLAEADPSLIPLIPVFLPSPLPYEVEQDYATWRDGIELQSSMRWASNLRTVWGAEVRRDSARSGRFLGTNEEVSTFLTRTYGNVEWFLGNHWILNAGAMYERNSLASNAWSPRVALLYELAPGHTVRASVSGARRTPTLMDSRGNYGFTFVLPTPLPSLVFPLITASGKVDSERVRSQELGYVFNIPKASFSGEARLFSDRYDGLIMFRGGDAVNFNEARTSGLDLSLNWKPLDATRVFLSLARNFAYSANTDEGRGYVASVPQNTLALFVDQDIADDLVFTINYQRVSKMFWTDGGAQNHVPNVIPAIDHLNLRLAKRINMGDHTAEIAGVIQNALGHYRDYYLGASTGTPDNIARRVAYLQVKIDY